MKSSCYKEVILIMEEKNLIDSTNTLRKVVNCLYIIIVFLILNSILLIISIGDNTTTDVDMQQEKLAYDVSQFIEMTTDQVMDAIQSEEMQIIYIGHETCNYCRLFIPVLQQAQQKFGYKTIYIDLDKVSTTDRQKISALDSFVEEMYGYTPMIIMTKSGQYVDGFVGYIDYEQFKLFLEGNGFKEKMG